MCQACPHPLQRPQELISVAPKRGSVELLWVLSVPLFVPHSTPVCLAPLPCFSNLIFEQKLLQKEATPPKTD